ncbi:MAG: nuclear transport factor 2 family protein [Sandaracinus sp.]|nr:nuclear transport factor 2 family protein [Sandaracinus sp.]
MHSPGSGAPARARGGDAWLAWASRPPARADLVCSQVKVHVLGTAAYVTCLEGHETQPPRLVATNVFVLEEGRWRMVHHQAGRSPEVLRPRPPSRPARRGPLPVQLSRERSTVVGGHVRGWSRKPGSNLPAGPCHGSPP